jgi:hypothetical protein
MVRIGVLIAWRGRGKLRPFLPVVPAKAGTHNRRIALPRMLGAPSVLKNTSLWLWVPDRAYACPGRRGERSRAKHKLPFSRRVASEGCQNLCPSIKEGAGNAGCPMDPRPPVQQKAQASATTGSPETSGIPCAMVLRLIRALPGDRALLPPSSMGRTIDLAPASGRQDHTISPSAKASFVRATNCAQRFRVHRIPLPTSVTIASRPS